MSFLTHVGEYLNPDSKSLKTGQTSLVPNVTFMTNKATLPLNLFRGPKYHNRLERNRSHNQKIRLMLKNLLIIFPVIVFLFQDSDPFL